MNNTDQPDLVAAQLAASVRQAINADGGWGYWSSKQSRLEPTCWSLLAIMESGAESVDEYQIDSVLIRLARWQSPGGLLTDAPGAPHNLAFNGLAAIAISRALSGTRRSTSRMAPALDALWTALLDGEGLKSGRAWTNRQDNQLTAWPWNLGTSSWVEPTAWCTLALKRTAPERPGPRIRVRIDDAERMLVDRCNLAGGWNYGNSNVLGKELQPYVPTTALALLALQDRQDLPAVARSASWLSENWRREPTPLALSLTLMAMRLYRQPVEAIRDALEARLASHRPPDNLAVRALASYALHGLPHGYGALAL